MSKENQVPRAMVLTEKDLEVLKEMFGCKSNDCPFTQEEVQFVRDWLDTAKTAKSEIVRWLVRGVIFLIGAISLVQVAFKMGWFKVSGK